jgi:hypothetical protein
MLNPFFDVDLLSDRYMQEGFRTVIFSILALFDKDFHGQNAGL